MKWEETVEEREQHLHIWFQKLAEVGHGEITVVFNRENNRIEINAQIRTRDGAALKIFEPTDK